MDTTIVVVDRGRRITFSFADVLRYHGPASPGGAAIGFRALGCALGRLGAGGPCDRRAIVVETAFGGPGARDAIELVTRAVTGERFRLDPALARPDRGRVLERFVFRVGAGGPPVTLLLRDGFVTEEFLDLARAATRDADQDRRLTTLKQQLADRAMAATAGALFEVEED
jgi:formylmethanofuran dehydrogenase subunit E